jgi:homoserine kinase
LGVIVRAGAFGVTLSGAGPTMLAWSPSAAAARVGRAMEKAFRRAGVDPVIRQLKIDTRGAVVR